VFGALHPDTDIMAKLVPHLLLLPCLVEAFSGPSLLPRAQRPSHVVAGAPARLRTGLLVLKAEDNKSEAAEEGAAPKKKQSKLKVFRMLDEAAEMLAEAVTMKPAVRAAASAVEAEPVAVEAGAAPVVIVRQDGEDAWRVMSPDAAAEGCAPGSEKTAEELAKTSAEAGMSRLDLLLQERMTQSDSTSMTEAELQVLAKAGDAARTALAEATAEGIPLSAFHAYEPAVMAKLAEFDLNGDGILDASEIVNAFKVLKTAASPGLSQTARKRAEEAAHAAVAASLAEPILGEGITYVAAKDEDEDLADVAPESVKAAPELVKAQVDNSALVEAEAAARAAVAASLAEGLPLRDGATYTAARDDDDWHDDEAQDSDVSGAEPAARDPALVKAEEAARAAVLAALAA
jgi:hypothetical protein